MKKTMLDLNGIKSRCFMLMVVLSLLLGATSCSNEKFEDNIPDQPKELSKAELIELALSRIPQTRGDAPIPIMMVTSKKTVTIRCEVTEEMTINWGDGSTNLITKNGSHSFTHTYSDDHPVYAIFLQGSNQAIKSLNLYKNELLFLDVANNIELEYISLIDNQLERLDLAGCPKLRSIIISYNNLSSINVSDSPELEELDVSNNQLTYLDVSKNLNLNYLLAGNNQIIALDLIKNTDLIDINLKRLPLDTINNLPISSASFAEFPLLNSLDISYTPFTSLDLSSNPLVYNIDISGTAITQLDVSSLQIEYLYATDSKLTNLIYTKNSLLEMHELWIEGTPFETLSSNLYPFLAALPDRNTPDPYGWTRQGRLFTNSSALITPLLSFLTAKNWVVNP